jgi:hypothetical protein
LWWPQNWQSPPPNPVGLRHKQSVMETAGNQAPCLTRRRLPAERAWPRTSDERLVSLGCRRARVVALLLVRDMAGLRRTSSRKYLPTRPAAREESRRFRSFAAAAMSRLRNPP